MTRVLMAVAKLELTSLTPILAKIEVNAAKNADKKANNNQDIGIIINFSRKGRSRFAGQLIFNHQFKKTY